MSYKIGVFGSSAGDEVAKTKNKAKALGVELGKHKCTVITGASTGLPYIVALAAYENGSEVLGFSPVIDLEAQKKFTPNTDLKIYKNISYIPKTFEFFENDLVTKKFRNVLSTANCDAGIIISGRWGTLNEFTNLIDMGKIVGVLTGTGGVADELPLLCSKISKEGSGRVIFSDSPKDLVTEVIKELETR